MCRLLYLPAGVRPKSLETDLFLLETKMGGHGNGIGFVVGGKEYIYKGEKYTVEECAKMLNEYPDYPALFHTRMVSCGGKTDDLCHPFSASMGKAGEDAGILVHNGHWDKGAFATSVLAGEWSDTKVASLYIHLHGWAAFCRLAPSGAWLYLTEEGVHVYKGWCADLYFNEQGALCSEQLEWGGRWKDLKPGEYGPHTMYVTSGSSHGKRYDEDYEYGTEITSYKGDRIWNKETGKWEDRGSKVWDHNKGEWVHSNGPKSPTLPLLTQKTGSYVRTKWVDGKRVHVKVSNGMYDAVTVHDPTNNTEKDIYSLQLSDYRNEEEFWDMIDGLRSKGYISEDELWEILEEEFDVHGPEVSLLEEGGDNEQGAEADKELVAVG